MLRRLLSYLTVRHVHRTNVCFLKDVPLSRVALELTYDGDDKTRIVAALNSASDSDLIR